MNDADILRRSRRFLLRRLSDSRLGGSRYREAAQETIGHNGFNHPQICRDVRGVLQALRADYAAGYLRTLEEPTDADSFGKTLSTWQSTSSATVTRTRQR